MRMSRRALLSTPAATSPPPPTGDSHEVRLWSTNGGGSDWTSDVYPDGIYGVFAAGATVDVDLSDDYDIYLIVDVNSFENPSEKVSYRQLDDVRVSFTMPDFDVAVEIETAY